MSQQTIKVDIVSAEASIYSGDVQMLFVSGLLGELGIAYGHTPLLTSIKPGQIRLQIAGAEEETYYVSSGILEVQPKIVTVLADTVIRADDIDEAAAQWAREQAEESLAKKGEDFDYARASTELAEALAQIQAVRRLRKK